MEILCCVFSPRLCQDMGLHGIYSMGTSGGRTAEKESAGPVMAALHTRHRSGLVSAVHGSFRILQFY